MTVTITRPTDATVDLPPWSARPTPYLSLDIPRAVDRLRAVNAALPDAAVHYAVKANPDPALLRALVAHGCRFDVASPAEVVACLDAGASPAHLLHSNPVARRADLAQVAALGVDLFVVDSPQEVDKLAEVAPGASVLARLVTSGEGSDWPLSRKFGCSTAQAMDLLRQAARQGLSPAGLSFHVGSQQRDPQAWDAPIASSARAFETLREEGLHLWLLDLGGGLPADLDPEVPELSDYGVAIEQALSASFGLHRPRVVLEPGRGIVAAAGVLTASVIGVVDRGSSRWVYLDVGVYTGLIETLDESIRYPLRTSAAGPTGPCVLAGPTCDSWDVMYEKTPVWLPLALAEGDLVQFEAAGAYTTAYSTVGFNGFAPLPTVLA